MKPACLALSLALFGALASPAHAQFGNQGLAQNLAGLGTLPLDPAQLPPPTLRNGQDVFASFREGLADPNCDAQATQPRWQRHFAHAPARLANRNDDALVLFAYVVEELRAADLPTEYALIPFVESGYQPAARNPSGPTGLWQFIATTARHHQVPVTAGYDGRLSAVDSTQAAVRYLKTLHGMFGGDWRLAVMGYNAGEYRILQSLRRAGMNASNADPAKLPGLSPITYAYVEKLHGLACVLEAAQTEPDTMAALDRAVPILKSHALPAGTDVQQWAAQRSLDPARIARLNPTLKAGTARTTRSMQVLAPSTHSVLAEAPADALVAVQTDPAPEVPPTSASRTPALANTRTTAATATRRHTVRRGESAWTIAKRYGMPIKTLLSHNGLTATSVLKPGTVLRLEASR